MGTMNISLPDGMKSFVDQQVSARGYGTSSEYVRELIRKDQDIQRLRALLLDERGATIGTGGGITALSVPEEEVAEARLKAAALLRALGAEGPRADTL